MKFIKRLLFIFAVAVFLFLFPSKSVFSTTKIEEKKEVVLRFGHSVRYLLKFPDYRNQTGKLNVFMHFDGGKILLSDFPPPATFRHEGKLHFISIDENLLRKHANDARKVRFTVEPDTEMILYRTESIAPLSRLYNLIFES